MNKLFISIVCLCLAGIAFSQGQTNSCPTGSAGYTWDNQKCEQCANDYCTCSKYNECDGCISGYVLDTVKKICVRCDGDNVTKCCVEMTTIAAGTYGGRGWATRAENCGMTGSKVQTLLFSSELGNTGVCTNPGWCTSLNEYGICKTCSAGYYLDESSMCKKCMEGCIECATSDHCTKCADNKYLDFTTKDNTSVEFPVCQNCNSGCLCSPTPSKNVQCASCMKGWYVTEDGATDDNRACADCNTKNAVECTKDKVITCQAGFVKTTDEKECKKCPDFCDNSATSNCTWKNDKAATSCTKCINHYYPKVEGDISTCVECDTSKYNRCNPSSVAGEVTIVQCGEDNASGENGYYKRAPHTGQQYLVSVKTGDKTAPTCVENINSCKTITPLETDTQACGDCYTDLQWLQTSENKCKQCQAERGLGCSSCTTDGANLACKECRVGYYAEQDAATSKITDCKICSTSITGCLECTDGSTCTKCAAEYRRTDDKQGCEQCTVPECKVCDTKAAECITCKDTRSLITIDGTQICEKCQASCLTCSPRNVCTSCASGYYLKDSKCLKAISKCESYSVSGSSSGSCDLCAYGYRKVTREDGFTICAPCDNSGVGYFNCLNNCSASGKKYPYRRDGAEYNAAAEKKRQETNPDPSKPSNSTGSTAQLVANIALFFGLFLALVL